MKNYLLALLFAASNLAFANADIFGTYEGKGNWKMEDASGTYTQGTEIVQTADGAAVKELLMIATADGQTHKESYEWTAVLTKNGFFEVHSNGKITGSGYCFETRCHIQASSLRNADSSYEETIVFGHKGMWRQGSSTSAKEGVVAWEGWFTKK